MKRVKKPKQKNVRRAYSEKELDRVKSKVTGDITKRLVMLFFAAAVDEIGITDEQMCAIYKRVERYADYIDDHVVHMKQLQKTIEEGTGSEMKGW